MSLGRRPSYYHDIKKVHLLIQHGTERYHLCRMKQKKTVVKTTDKPTEVTCLVCYKRWKKIAARLEAKRNRAVVCV